jgi:beta-glucuronidase
VVRINGRKLVENKGGFLPFEVDLSEAVNWEQENKLVVKLNNKLSLETLPPGQVIEEEREEILKQQHEFYHYTGIHRPVYVYKTPKTYIRDIQVSSDFEENIGRVDVPTGYIGDSNIQVLVEIFNFEKYKVAEGVGSDVTVNIQMLNCGNL